MYHHHTKKYAQPVPEGDYHKSRVIRWANESKTCTQYHADGTHTHEHECEGCDQLCSQTSEVIARQ